MTSRMSPQRRSARLGEHGQMIVIFALCLVGILAMAGLLVDGGLAWSNRRQAQAAADTAALAAAKNIVANGTGVAAAQAAAGLNGFGPGTDCAGSPLASGGVEVNRPPLTGPHNAANDPLHNKDYVEVVTTRKMSTTFSNAIGLSCWMISARAVASVGTTSVASCSFCSLNNTNGNHTLVLKNGATLRVDGDIYVNSSNGGYTPGSCGKQKDWFVCGDGFDIFGDCGKITARTISVNGGWETHDNGLTYADRRVAGCVDSLDPPAQPNPPPSNVCIHMPQIADPLNDGSGAPANVIPIPPDVGPPTIGQNGCPAGALLPSGTAGSPVTMTISSGNPTICPGTYHGGLDIKGSANVRMLPGVYYMAGGGFTVANAASVDGTAGVMIYNSSGTAAVDDTNPGVDLVPAKDKTKKDTKIDKNGGLTAAPNKNITIGESVVLTFQIERPKASDPLPTGTITFYDGQDPISALCTDVPVSAGSNGDAVKATCTTSWGTFGTKSVSAVYSGDAIYNAIGDNLTITIPPPAGALIAPISITGIGDVKLYGPTSGAYKGLTLFQNRSSNLTITLAPGAGAGACQGPWLTQDVPDVSGVNPPAACGALGGIRGTIYAGNSNALVYVTASGLADLQIISGKIQIDSDADARFAYTPQFFANGNIRLIE